MTYTLIRLNDNISSYSNGFGQNLSQNMDESEAATLAYQDVVHHFCDEIVAWLNAKNIFKTNKGVEKLKSYLMDSNIKTQNDLLKYIIDFCGRSIKGTT
jgi:hypothetical protein